MKCAACCAPESSTVVEHEPKLVTAHQTLASQEPEEGNIASTEVNSATDGRRSRASDAGRSSRMSAASTMSSTATMPSPRSTRLSRATDQELEEFSSKVTFRGNPELLRATYLTTVMQRGAVILDKGKGSSKTYDLSEVVSSIEFFLSHNWVVHRARKFLCLAMYFNLGPAVLAALATCVIMATAASLGTRIFVAKTPLSGTDSSLGLIEHGCGCTLLMAPVLFIATLFGHDLRRLAGFRGCTMFLDKTCIHQTDKELQKEGICKLGAFLRSSRQMIVMYTDIYLTKLWTVYEVACFLSLQSNGHLIVVPTFQPVLVFGGTLVCYVSTVVTAALGNYGPAFALASAIGIAICTFVLLLILRRWSREKEAIRQRVLLFEVSECTCFDEDDRPVVYNSIALFMRLVGEAHKDGTQQDALQAFNRVVRKRVGRSVASSIGAVGLEYKHVVTVLLCTIFPYFVDISLGIVEIEEEWITRWRICTMIYGLASTFGMYPLMIAVLAWWCGLCLQLKGYKERFWLVFGWCWILVVLLAFDNSLSFLRWAAVLEGRSSYMFVAILVVVSIASAMLAGFVYNRGRRLRDEEQQEEARARAVSKRLNEVVAEVESVSEKPQYVEEDWERERLEL